MYAKLVEWIEKRFGDEINTSPTLIDGKTGQVIVTDEKPVVRFGLTTLLVGFGGFMLWAGLAPLDEGVPGTGVVSVESKRKTVQHLRGGLVEAIKVREGDLVKAGDELVRLNDTEAKAQLDITRGQYWLVRAAEARLQAEREGRTGVVFPDDLKAAAPNDPRAIEAMQAQERLFQARRSALSSEMGMMDESIAGLQQQMRGLESLQQGKKTQIDLINKELASLRELAQEGFVPRNKLYELERVLADLSGTRGEDMAQIARFQAGISETKLRKLARQQDFRKEVETQIADVQRDVGTQADRMKALSEELERTIIKSPTDGAVVGLEVHTLGGVIRPGDRIMDIVPQGDVLVVDAQLPVNLIDKVHVGLLADVHINIVHSGGASPVIEGRLTQVSADRQTEPRSGMPYYTARIELTPNGEETLRQHKIKVQAGMPTDVIVKTGERTLLQYLMKPLVSRISSGLREQ